MKNPRFPYLLLAVGLIGMALYPRLLPTGAPAVFRTDFVEGLVRGVFLGVEILGCVLIIRARRGISSCCRR